MIQEFWDEGEGGFFYTGQSHESLIARTKDLHDSSIPSGNSLEELLSRRAVIKKVDGQPIQFYPPAHRLNRQAPARPAQWGYALCGLRAYAPTLLEAEREALKILRAMRHLGR